MTDLTLYEYRDLSEEELGQILHEEARKMFDADSLGIDSGEAANCSYTPFQHKDKRTDYIFQYWVRIMDFIQSNIQKIFSNSARIFFKRVSRMYVHLFCRASPINGNELCRRE